MLHRRSGALAALFAFASSVLATSVSGCAAGSGDDIAAGGSGGGTSGDGGAPTHIDPLPLPPNTYSHGDPSPLEQQLLEITQSVRLDPADAGETMVALPSVQNEIQQFGVDTQQVIEDFKALAPVPPLAFNPSLLQSSQVHSDDMAANGFQEHDGSAGEHFYDRISQAGYDYSLCSENIFSYAKSPEHCNAAFCIDWGNPDFGHRKAIMDLDGAKRDIGIGIVENPTGPGVGPLVVTEDFGEPLQDKHRYLVGVVFTDTNGNGLYDAGEGMAGMNIVPAVGDTYATTSESGGYAIPFLPNAGAFKVQLQNANGKALAEADTTLAADNVKVDFIVH